MGMEKYLESSAFIDWRHPAIVELAVELAEMSHSETELAKLCFEWVRDNIRHNWDYQQSPVTCKASDVLLHRTGYCYAKSHLLAALLRANEIPAGLCYQRLSLEGNGPPYCMHGLNCVYLQDYGWHRIDSRGNQPGVDAEFQPLTECLALIASGPSEANFSGIYAEPLPVVAEVLTSRACIFDVFQHLPDMPIHLGHKP